MSYIIRTDVPFTGTAQSILLPDGTVAWSGGKTVDEYAADRGFPVRTVSDDEMTEMVRAYTETLRSPPTPISAQRWDDMLNVLPPCRWRQHDGVELFHVSERITDDLVNWFAKVGEHHFSMVDRASADAGALATAVKAALSQAVPHSQVYEGLPS